MAKITGWDPVLLISQIVSMQSLHYLTLSILIPPLLTIFAEPAALEYDGGATNVGMVMDWREIAGRLTARTWDGPWSSWKVVWSGGKQVGSTEPYSGDWNGTTDPTRGWIIAACWLAASAADVYYLYSLIRRPRLILDFSLTLIFNHLVLTTYYSKAVPTSLFFWAIMVASAVIMVVAGEQLCVKREMTEGLAVAASNEADELEMGNLLRRD